MLAAAAAEGLDLIDDSEVWLHCGGGVSAALAAAVLTQVHARAHL